jgi:hypothetical protein
MVRLALVVLSLLAVAGCAGTVAGTAVPAPTVKPAPSTPAPPPFSGNSGFAIFATLKQQHQVTYPMGDACAEGVRYNDSACGTQLRGLNDVAVDVIGVLSGHSDPQSGKTAVAAKDVTEAFSTLADLGCFGLPAKGKTLPDGELEELCPTLPELEELSFLSLESSVQLGSF